MFAFVPVFMVSSYPSFKAQYASLNAAAFMIFGLLSSGVEMIVSEKYEKKNPWTNAILNIAQVGLSIPLLMLGMLNPTNFWLSMACVASIIFITGSHLGPSITMIQNAVSSKMQSSTMNLFFIT